MRRPALLLFILFIIAEIISLKINFLIAFSLLIVSIIVIFIFRYRYLYLLFFFASAVFYNSVKFNCRLKQWRILKKEEFSGCVRGVVVSHPQTRFLKTHFYLKAGKLLCRVRCKFSSKRKKIPAGMELIIHGKIFPAEEKFALRGIYYNIEVKDTSDLKLVCVRNRFLYFLWKVRQSIKHVIFSNLSGFPARFLSAIFLGDRGDLTPKDIRIFQNTGVIHLLAVSGLHSGLICAIIYFFLRIIGISGVFNFLLSSVFLFLYCGLVGFLPPVLRASILSSLFLLGISLERSPDTLNLLCFAGLLMLIFEPSLLFSISFQLSFCAVAGIVLLYPFVHNFLFRIFEKCVVDKYALYDSPFNNLFLKPLSVSLSAQIATYPFIAFYFNKISLIGIFANLFAIPLTAVFLINGILMILFSLLKFSFLSSLFAGVCWLTSKTLYFSLNLLSKLPFAYFWVKSPSILFFVFYYLGLFLLVKGRFIFPFLLFCFNFYVWSFIFMGYREISAGANRFWYKGLLAICEIKEVDFDIVKKLHREGVRYLKVIIHKPSKNYKLLTRLLREFKVEEVYMEYDVSDDINYYLFLGKIKEKIPKIFLIDKIEKCIKIKYEG